MVSTTSGRGRDSNPIAERPREPPRRRPAFATPPHDHHTSGTSTMGDTKSPPPFTLSDRKREAWSDIRRAPKVGVIPEGVVSSAATRPALPVLRAKSGSIRSALRERRAPGAFAKNSGTRANLDDPLQGVTNRQVRLSRRGGEPRPSGPSPSTAPASVRRRTHTVTEVAVILGIGRSTAYSLAQRGEIRALRVGGRIVVPVHEVERLLAGDDAA